MSRREILEDFYILGRKYEEGGDCCLAAAEAWEFYNRLHTLMRPKLVTGILYSDSVMPKLKKTGISPRCLAGISPLYQAFRLEVQHISSHVVLVVIALDLDLHKLAQLIRSAPHEQRHALERQPGVVGSCCCWDIDKPEQQQRVR